MTEEEYLGAVPPITIYTTVTEVVGYVIYYTEPMKISTVIDNVPTEIDTYKVVSVATIYSKGGVRGKAELGIGRRRELRKARGGLGEGRAELRT